MIFTNSFFSAQILSSPADDREENGVPAAILSLSSHTDGLNDGITDNDRDENRAFAMICSLSLGVAGLNDDQTSHNREENGVPAAILSLSSQLKGPYCDISAYYREENGTYPRFLPYRLKKEERDGRKRRKKGKDGRNERKERKERKKKDGLSRNLEPVLRFYKSGHISVRSTWCPLYVLSEFGQVHVTLLGQSLMQGECLLQCMAGLTLFGNLQVVPHELLVVRMHAVLDDTLGALGR